MRTKRLLESFCGTPGAKQIALDYRLKDYKTGLEQLQQIARAFIRSEFSGHELFPAEVDALATLFIRTGKIPAGFCRARVKSKGRDDANSGKTTAPARQAAD